MTTLHLLKLAHILGLVMFLGSILTFIVISSQITHASLENFAFSRNLISAGTSILTVPGLWAVVSTGFVLGYRKYGIHNRFFQLKALLATLILLNAQFLVVPAVQTATRIASQSLHEGRLLPIYSSAFLREEIFGAFNILLTLTAAAVALLKIETAQLRNTSQSFELPGAQVRPDQSR